MLCTSQGNTPVKVRVVALAIRFGNVRAGDLAVVQSIPVNAFEVNVRLDVLDTVSHVAKAARQVIGQEALDDVFLRTSLG